MVEGLAVVLGAGAGAAGGGRRALRVLVLDWCGGGAGLVLGVDQGGVGSEPGRTRPGDARSKKDSASGGQPGRDGGGAGRQPEALLVLWRD